jgi:3-oxoacyl-[acyl-carrier-protein] synthase II
MRAVITGVGVLSTVGIGADRTFDNTLNGEAPRGTPDGSFALIPGFDPKIFLGERGIRHFDRTALLLASAARLALDESELGEGSYRGDETGVVIGSTHGSIHAIAEFDREALVEGPRYVNPQAFSNTVINAPASRLSILHGATGLNSTLASGSASALDAIAHGITMLRAERISLLICGAALGQSPELADGYRRAGRLARDGAASPPFGTARHGPVPAEGAAVFAIEEESRALRRGARSLAAVSGAGSAFALDCGGEDPGEVLALEASMRVALEEAELSPEEVSCVVASAAGAPEGDRVEAEAIGRVFRPRGPGSSGGVPVTAPKSIAGDSFEASPAIGVAIAVVALERQRIPPIARLTNADPDFSGLDLVRGAAREASLRHVLVLGRDDSGHCASVLVSAP